MGLRILAASLALGLGFSASTAQADIVVGSFSGVIGGPLTVDSLGEFGAVGADLTGDLMIASFNFDTASFQRYPCASTGPGETCSFWESLASISNAAMTINGTTKSLTLAGGSVFLENNPDFLDGYAGIDLDLSAYVGGVTTAIDFTFTEQLATIDLDHLPTTLDFVGPYGGAAIEYIDTTKSGTWESFYTSSYSVSFQDIEASVPEPSALLLMASGLALFVVCRRERDRTITLSRQQRRF
jgi:hypothetical protein